MQMLSPRQVHLDFHTSEWIEGVGAQFDAETFARMAKEAAVSSMTVFARCHHGWLYYDSWRFPERVHPHLANRNLLVEQVRALHAQGIKAPVYITVQWDYYTANRHPEWLIRKPDGAHEGGPFSEPGFYQSLCVNTGYWKFLQEQTLEVMELLGDELDGLFFDIVGIRPCTCAACRKKMLEKGLDFGDEAQVRAFAKQSIDRFKQKMSAFVREHNDRCTIFYNAGHVGPCTKDSKEAYTHFELESLPSGGWGYLHLDFSEEGGSSALALLRGPVEELTREAQMEEFMFLGLRMTKGISEIDFVSMFGVKIEGVYGPVIERLIGDGLLKREGVWISLTEWGMDVSNFVLSEFLL